MGHHWARGAQNGRVLYHEDRLKPYRPYFVIASGP